MIGMKEREGKVEYKGKKEKEKEKVKYEGKKGRRR